MHEILPWLAKAAKHGGGDETAEQMLGRAYQGEYVLWYSPQRYAMVVQIQHHCSQSVCVVVALGGSNLELIAQDAVQIGIPWARQQGATVLRVCGRRGWERVLGLTHVGHILQKDIT